MSGLHRDINVPRNYLTSRRLQKPREGSGGWSGPGPGRPPRRPGRPPPCRVQSELSFEIVDTVFGHVSFDTYLGLVKYRSADEATVTSLQGSCRWRWLPKGKQLNVTKSRGGDVFVPMTSINVCRWPQQEVCRWLWRKAWRLPIDS